MGLTSAHKLQLRLHPKEEYRPRCGLLKNFAQKRIAQYIFVQSILIRKYVCVFRSKHSRVRIPRPIGFQDSVSPQASSMGGVRAARPACAAQGQHAESTRRRTTAAPSHPDLRSCSSGRSVSKSHPTRNGASSVKFPDSREDAKILFNSIRSRINAKEDCMKFWTTAQRAPLLRRGLRHPLRPKGKTGPRGG